MRAILAVGDEDCGVAVENDAISSSESPENSSEEDMADTDAADDGADSAAAVDEVAGAVAAMRGASVRRRVPHLLTKKRSSPKLTSTPACRSTKAGSMTGECGLNPREPKKIGDCRSGELPAVDDEAAESVDPTPVFPTDGAN